MIHIKYMDVKQCNITLYADDTLLLFAHKDLNVIKQLLESDLSNATFWLKENKLHLNVSKTKWTLFGTQKRLYSVMYPSVTVNGQELERVNQYKYLGVFPDTCLDLNHHIMYITMCLYITITILLWVLSIYPFIKHYTIDILS